MWKESAEPGVVTAAAPNTYDDDLYGGNADSQSLSQGANNRDDDVSSRLPLAYRLLTTTQDFISVPYHATSSMSLQGEENKKTSPSAAPTTNQTRVHVPPHLHGIDDA